MDLAASRVAVTVGAGGRMVLTLPVGVAAANAAYEDYRARGVMKDGRRFGGPPKPYEPPALPAGKINTTDPDSRNVKTRGGYLQGYNAQAATNERQIVIAAEVTNASPDFGQLEPIVSAAQAELERAGITDTPQVLVADAGYWHQEQMEQVVERGIQVLIPPDAGKRKSPRQPRAWLLVPAKAAVSVNRGLSSGGKVESELLDVKRLAQPCTMPVADACCPGFAPSVALVEASRALAAFLRVEPVAIRLVVDRWTISC